MRFLSVAICWALAAVSKAAGALDAPHSSLSALASRSDDGSYIYRYSYADAPRDVIGPDDVMEPAYPPANATDLAAVNASNTTYDDDDCGCAHHNSTLGVDDWMLSDDNGTYSYAYDTYYNDRNNLTGTYYTPYYYNGYEDNVNSDSTTVAAASAAAAAGDFADDIPHGGLLLYDVDDDTALAALNAVDDATLERTWVSQTLAAWSALYTVAFFGNATAAPSTPPPQPPKPIDTDATTVDGPVPFFFEWYFGNASAAPSSRVALFYGVFFGNQSAPSTPSAPVQPHDKGMMVPQPQRRRLLHRPSPPSPSPRAGWGSFHLRGSHTA